jgi:hypothetical protein
LFNADKRLGNINAEAGFLHAQAGNIESDVTIDRNGGIVVKGDISFDKDGNILVNGKRVGRKADLKEASVRFVPYISYKH